MTFIVEVKSMRIIVQRVKSASVTVEGKGKVSSIGPGILALVGIHENDTQEDLQSCCRQLLGCKLWENEDGRFWRYVFVEVYSDALIDMMQ